MASMVGVRVGGNIFMVERPSLVFVVPLASVLSGVLLFPLDYFLHATVLLSGRFLQVANTLHLGSLLLLVTVLKGASLRGYSNS